MIGDSSGLPFIADRRRTKPAGITTSPAEHLGGPQHAVGPDGDLSPNIIAEQHRVTGSAESAVQWSVAICRPPSKAPKAAEHLDTGTVVRSCRGARQKPRYNHAGAVESRRR